MITRQFTRTLLKDNGAGLVQWDTGEALSIKTDAGALVCNATESPAGLYTFNWTAFSAYGYIYMGSTQMLSWGHIWLGEVTGNINLEGDFEINATVFTKLDNTFDLGAVGSGRFRDFFLGHNATIGGTLGVTGITTLSNNLLGTGAIFSASVSGLNAIFTGTGSFGGAITAGSLVIGTTHLINGTLYTTGTSQNLDLQSNGGKVYVGRYADDVEMFGVDNANGNTRVAGTFTATGQSHTFGNGATTSADTQININGKVGYSRVLYFQTAGSPRWAMLANNEAETGANAGSNFRIFACDDAGAYLNNWFLITRATGTTYFQGDSVNLNSGTVTPTIAVHPASGASQNPTFIIYNNAYSRSTHMTLDNDNQMARIGSYDTRLWLLSNGNWLLQGDTSGNATFPGIINGGNVTTGLTLTAGNDSPAGTTLNQVVLGWHGGPNTYQHTIKTRHDSAGNVNNAIDFYTWQTGQAAGTVGNLLNLTVAGGGITPAVFVKNTYTTGWTAMGGAGYILDYNSTVSGKSYMELDQLLVRGRMDIYELVVNEIRATNGSLWVSDSGKVDSIPSTNDVIFIDPTNSGLQPFAVNDLIMVQIFNNSGSHASVRQVQAQVTAINVAGNTARITVNYLTAQHFLAGDWVVRAGSTSDTTRQNSIYLTADDSNNPRIDILAGVSTFNSSVSSGLFNYANVKARLGNLAGISDTINGIAVAGYGFYSQNAFLKGVIVASGGNIAGWSLTPTYISKGDTVSAGHHSLAMNTATVTSSDWYADSAKLEGFEFKWLNNYNAGHLVLGQMADKSAAGTVKTNFYGLQMMGYDLSEYFALGVDISQSYSGATPLPVYNRIAGWSFTNTKLSKTFASPYSTTADHANISIDTSDKAIYYIDDDATGSAYVKMIRMGHLRDAGTGALITDYGFQVALDGVNLIMLSQNNKYISGWNFTSDTFSARSNATSQIIGGNIRTAAVGTSRVEMTGVSGILSFVYASTGSDVDQADLKPISIGGVVNVQLKSLLGAGFIVGTYPLSSDSDQYSQVSPTVISNHEQISGVDRYIRIWNGIGGTGPELSIDGNKVVGPRKTGWVLTNLVNPGTRNFDFSTQAGINDAVRALAYDLYNVHGLIGA